MTSARIEIRPMAGSLGADIDLAGPVDDGIFAAIRQALDDHLVIHLHGLDLAPEELVALTRRFGPVSRAPYIRHMDGHPDIVAVKKTADERKVSTFGNAWHSDFSFLDQPPMASLLYACEVPSHGGDTLFANMVAAYEALSEGMRRLLDGLDAMHAGKPYGTGGVPGTIAVSRSIAIERNRPEADREVAHPVVRIHPDTGRKALFVNPIYTTRFAGMTAEESEPLLDFLYAHAVRPEFTCRLRWRVHDLAIWDNRCTLHYAVNDYDGQDRLLYRTMVQGERPVPAVPRA
ncbi:TauD/TfdA family dioxygenase [Inquilinus limosus]|uniref:TauD/TfdA dioxygenase family protein n=1 Tax=Inquilinus limosus TaxID=171674 RepID=UPI003F17877D